MKLLVLSMSTLLLLDCGLQAMEKQEEEIAAAYVAGQSSVNYELGKAERRAQEAEEKAQEIAAEMTISQGVSPEIIAARIRKLLEDGADINGRIDPNLILYCREHVYGQKTRHETLLHLAVRLCNIEIIAELLDSEGIDIERENEQGYRPLHVAAYRGHLGIFNLLVEHGANINALTTHKENYNFGITREYYDSDPHQGLTALHIASKHGHLAIVRALLDRQAPTNAPDSTGRTPLDCAGLSAAECRVLVENELLGRGATRRPTQSSCILW